jgi:hypothetical protein
MSFHHRAYGFRGKAKGGGFRAYLKAERIPERKAYRLIERYRRMEAIWDRVQSGNAPLDAELFSLPPVAELQAMSDGDPDTNAPASARWEVDGQPVNSSFSRKWEKF